MSDATEVAESNPPAPTADPARLGVRELVVRHRELIAALVTAGIVGAIASYRLTAIRDARYPGHADPAFYYGVAQNLHDGHGATINYIWEFLTGFPDLPRFAFDYWLPLPSALMSLSLGVHDDLRTALGVSVLMSVLLAIGAYLLARSLSDVFWVPAASAVLVTVQPVVSTYSVQSEASLYLGAFAVLALAAAVSARTRSWLWPVAGALAGLANLSRNEGMLLVPVLALAAVGGSRQGRRWLHAGATVAAYLAVMGPLFVMSLRHLGTLLPSSATRVPFIEKYEDLFAVWVERSWSKLFGLDAIRLRLSALSNDLFVGLNSMNALTGVVLLVLIGSALPAARSGGGGWRSVWRSPWFPLLAFPLAMFALYAFVAPVVAATGAVSKGMAAIAPLLCVGGMAALGRLGVRTMTAAGLVAVLAATPLVTMGTTTRAAIATNNAAGAFYANLAPSFQAEERCLGTPLVIMTRNPWELTQVTGFRAVQIPNGSLDTILAVARRYGVTNIELAPQRAALADVQALVGADGPFSRSSVSFRGRPIYRIKSQTAHAAC